jgi:hypothetical protein
MNMQAEFQYMDLLNKDKDAKLKLESLEKGWDNMRQYLYFSGSCPVYLNDI